MDGREKRVLITITITSPSTRRRQIMRKLNIFNIPQVTKYALREGLISL